MVILAWIGLAFSAWVYQAYTWNRAIAMTGKVGAEMKAMSLLCMIALPVFVWSIKTVFSL